MLPSTKIKTLIPKNLKLTYNYQSIDDYSTEILRLKLLHTFKPNRNLRSVWSLQSKGYRFFFFSVVKKILNCMQSWRPKIAESTKMNWRASIFSLRPWRKYSDRISNSNFFDPTWQKSLDRKCCFQVPKKLVIASFTKNYY